jgi:MFS family permease
VVPLSLLIWLLAGSRFTWLVAFAALLGIAYGGWIALAPAVVARHYGTEGLGRVLGLLYTAGAFGVLAGPPATGLIVDLTDGYATAIILAIGVGLVAWNVLGGLDSRPTSVAASVKHRTAGTAAVSVIPHQPVDERRPAA